MTNKLDITRRKLILGGLAVLLSGCAKSGSKEPVKRTVKKQVKDLDTETLDTRLQDPQDILETIPSYVSGFQVGNRFVNIDDLAVYPVKKGDNLSKIAERFYGSSDSWREVYELNKGARELIKQFNPQYLGYLIGDNPNKIKEGQLIILEKAVEDFTLPKRQEEIK